MMHNCKQRSVCKSQSIEDRRESPCSCYEKATNGICRCIEEGIPIIGYIYWSLLDNFEWQKENKTFSPSAFCYIVRKKQDNVNIYVLSFSFFLYYNTYIEIFIHRFKRIISPSTKLYHPRIRRSLL